MKTINARLDEMTKKLNSRELLQSKGLGNEINFHIFDYDPEDEYVVRDYLENYLLKRESLNIKVFDIYDIIIDILKERNFLGKVFDFEKKRGIKYLNETISRTLGIGSNNDLILKRIRNEIAPDQIIFITGIGKCYGIVRGHTILNNLHSAVLNNPLIMLYPGKYNGQTFKLFNCLDNDNYYRAFQLVEGK